MSRIGIPRPKHVSLILSGQRPSCRLGPLQNHTHRTREWLWELATSISSKDIPFRYLKHMEVKEDMNLKGRTSLSSSKFVTWLRAHPLKAPGASNPPPVLVPPSPQFSGAWNKGFWGKKLFPPCFFSCLHETYECLMVGLSHITRFPLMKRPTAGVPLTPTKMEIWNFTLQDLCGSLGASYSWFWRRRCVSSTWVRSFIQQQIILTLPSSWGTHVSSLRAEICVCLIHSFGLRI